MKKYSDSMVLKTGLAIFAMLFGSANLIFPIKIGALSGSQTFIGLIGFILSGILIPITGLISMVFFDGDYKAFFHRIGKMPGDILIFLCMLAIGPLIAMPRIITFSYSALTPVLGTKFPLIAFSIIFAVITFSFAYKKSSVIDAIGKILSPLLLLSLGGIFIIGYIFKDGPQISNLPALDVFNTGISTGYSTLDLLGTIFFGYIAISILYTNEQLKNKGSRYIAKTMLYSSAVAGTLLALIYGSLAYLGTWYGSEFALQEPGSMFINTVLNIVGPQGAAILGLTVFLACLTTIIALVSVVGEYLRNDVLKNKLCYITCLIIVLAMSVYLSQYSLGMILYYSDPIINIAYPILIVLTFCNLAYKLWNFKPVKIPVLITLILSIYLNGPKLLKVFQNPINHIKR